MKLIQPILFLAACVAGFMFHGILIEPGGMLAKLIWVAPKNTQGSATARNSNPGSPSGNNSSDSVTNIGGSSGNTSGSESSSGFSWKLAQKEDFPETCVLIRDASVKLTSDNSIVKLERGAQLRPVSVKGLTLIAQASQLNGSYVQLPVEVTNLKMLTVKNYRIRLGIADANTGTNTDANTGTTGPTIARVDPKVNIPSALTDRSTDLEIRTMARNGAKNLKTLKGAKPGTGKTTVLSDETIDNIIYQVGAVTFTKDTLFGTRELEVRAYIRNKKIQLWRWKDSTVEVE